VTGLLRVELRRACHRRIVRVLVLLALCGIAVFGVVLFFTSTHLDVAAARSGQNEHAAVLTDWWRPGTGEGVLMVAAGLLAVCAVLGGASVVGGEWRAGTVASVLAWEPRRARVFVARSAASMVIAFAVAVALQTLFVAAAVPSMLAHGSTDGADGAWWSSFALAIVRVALFTALAAAIGGSLAWIGRSTVAALVGVFGWLLVAENLVRGLRPGAAKYLLTSAIGTVVPWAPMKDPKLARGVWGAAVTVLVVTGALLVIGLISFTRRDVVAS
jgi:ABC-2 type transport system permease protein